MTAAAARTWALRALNVALEPLGLVLRTHAQERAWRAEREAITAGYWRAGQKALSEARAAHAAADHLAKIAEQLGTMAAQRLAHLRTLDVLVEDFRTSRSRAARRVLDVALGRDVERAA
jgi:hypothetical protein